MNTRQTQVPRAKVKKNVFVRARELVRIIVLWSRYVVLKFVFGMNICKTARVSFGTRLDRTNPKGIFIGHESYVASGALVLSHDYCRGLYFNTRIGERCFIGANAIIMPGVTIGDSVIIGAGTVVSKDVPSGSIVVGNPGRIISNNVETERFGVIKNNLAHQPN